MQFLLWSIVAIVFLYGVHRLGERLLGRHKVETRIEHYRGKARGE